MQVHKEQHPMDNTENIFSVAHLDEEDANWLHYQANGQVMVSRLINEFWGGLDVDMPDELKNDLVRMYAQGLLLSG